MIKLEVLEGGRWLMVGAPPTIEDARARGNALYKAGAAGVRIAEQTTVTIAEKVR